MKYIKKLIFIIMPVIFLIGCSNLGINNQQLSEEAIQRSTMTKVQNDVNVIMDKSDDYVLKNMGNPYSTIYSLKIDEKNDFKDIKNIKNVDIEDIEVLSTGLLYPKYTSDYKLDGSAIYIEVKQGKVKQVETCDFKDFDVTQVMDKKSNIVISSYTDYNNLKKENIDKKNLENYIGKSKDSISDIIKHKKCQYSIYIDEDGISDIDIYNIEDSDFLVIQYKNNSIVYVGEQDCSNILSKIKYNN